MNAVREKVSELAAADDLLLLKIFDDKKIQSLIDEILGDESTKRRNRIYTPQVTLSLFVQQVLSKESGCKEMVTLLNKQRKTQQLSEVSTNTTSFCQARSRLPLELIRKLIRETADLATRKMPSSWRWFQHRILLVDGLVINAPDTPENQEKYPLVDRGRSAT